MFIGKTFGVTSTAAAPARREAASARAAYRLKTRSETARGSFFMIAEPQL
jgi:hypothetical protein